MKLLVRSAKQLGAALQRCRRLQSLSQTELARKAGLRQGTVSQLESGLEGVKIATVMNLLRALDLEIIIQPRSKGSPQDIEDMF